MKIKKIMNFNSFWPENQSILVEFTCFFFLILAHFYVEFDGHIRFLPKSSGLRGCESKKVKNRDFFDFHEFGRLDLSMVKIDSRPTKLKIWVEILLGNHLRSIFSKYELDPTEIKYILQSCKSKKVKNHDFFWFWWIWTSRLVDG